MVSSCFCKDIQDPKCNCRNSICKVVFDDPKKPTLYLSELNEESIQLTTPELITIPARDLVEVDTKARLYVRKGYTSVTFPATRQAIRKLYIDHQAYTKKPFFLLFLNNDGSLPMTIPKGRLMTKLTVLTDQEYASVTKALPHNDHDSYVYSRENDDLILKKYLERTNKCTVIKIPLIDYSSESDSDSS
jgi:hypothetical protein